MTKMFSVFAAVFMLALGIAGSLPAQAATANYGQAQGTGAYAAGGSAYGPPSGSR